ncbi:hypothetical protein [Polyangium jinanense]|uniref:Uncharacterized protein n=1 Tax=Polyangium jinanense TaxID=2829994 RepID=A0A9X3XJQ7_9BACT|nr:hypothetical protein [Polyangium jinanense]MDC3989326.1 hypothetical protein [Polyangium jinanense]
MVHGRTVRDFWCGASGEKRTRGVLAALGFFSAALLPACSGCQVEIERSTATHADGLYRHLLVGGTEPDGAFVLALHERAPGDEELVLVSLAEGEKRTCSLGKAAWYTTLQPQPPWYGDDEPSVDPRPARILTLEGDIGAKSGDLLIFDASCVERMRVPSVEGWLWPLYGAQGKHVGYAARTTSGKVVTIDPWAGSVHTIAENVSFSTYMLDKFWLIEGGSVVVRDRDGKTLQTAGSGVTELATYSGDQVAYVDAKGLWVLKLGDPEPTAIPTAAAPCKPEYFYTGSIQLAYRDDCAAGVLAVRDLTTGDTRVLSDKVTSTRFRYDPSMSWIFFEREEPGKKRELWAVPGAGEPVLVGTNPRPNWYPGRSAAGFLFDLDHDGAAGTLGTWTLEGGFSPLLENSAGSWGGYTDHFAAFADVQEDVGTLVVYDRNTLAEALRIPRVHSSTPTFARQVAALGYVHDWDDALGEGTLGVWIPYNGQQIDVDTGVTEFTEIFWPEPGILYAVRAPERAGLWTAYPDL